MEILSEIFSYLTVREFLSVSEVCKTFHSIVNAKAFLNRICANLNDCESFRTSMRHYDACKIFRAGDEQLEKFHHMFAMRDSVSASSVRSLKLDDVEINCKSSLMMFLSHFDNVEELSLEGIYLKDTSSSAGRASMPQLKTLKFFYSTNVLLSLFADVIGTLEVFKVCLLPHEDENEKNQNYQLVITILSNNRTTLRKLNLYEVNFGDEFLEQIASIDLTQLTKFSMSFNSYLLPDSKGFERFVKNNKATLEKFKIRTFDHVKQHQLQVLIDHAVNIRSLNLIVCSHCDYESFSDFRKLEKLEKLKLCPTTFCAVGDRSYAKFVKDKILNHQNKSMKSATIMMLPMSSEVVAKIISSFPNLVILNLSSESEVTENQVYLLKDKLTSLKMLFLDDCNMV